MIVTCFVILGVIEIVWVGMARDGGGIIALFAGSQMLIKVDISSGAIPKSSFFAALFNPCLFSFLYALLSCAIPSDESIVCLRILYNIKWCHDSLSTPVSGFGSGV